MAIHVFTSQSLNYFNSIGKYSLASVFKHLPQDTKITVTTENSQDFPSLNSRITLLDLYALDNGFREFENRWTGKTMQKVINFAKKGHTILYATENFNHDIMIWLDADAFIKQPITETFLQGLLQGNLSAHLGVMHDSGEFCVESGFFVFDLAHPARAQFAAFYRDYYDNDRCENMGRFYDSNVHGHAVQDCERVGIRFTEMNLRKKGNTPIRGSMIDSHAGHFKGKVKHNAEEHYQALGISDYVAKVLA